MLGHLMATSPIGVKQGYSLTSTITHFSRLMPPKASQVSSLSMERTAGKKTCECVSCGLSAGVSEQLASNNFFLPFPV